MTSHNNPRTEVVANDAVSRALDAYHNAGGRDSNRAREMLKAALVDNTFKIGDEVMTEEGAMVGVIIEIHDDEAVISWSMRGKSSEPVDTLEHVAHQPKD